MADAAASAENRVNGTPANGLSRTSEHAENAAAMFAHGRVKGAAPSEGDGLYRLLVESVADYAIFALDPQGHVLNWNVGAQRFKGYTPEEIIGQHFSIFYQPEDQQSDKPKHELEIAERVGRLEDEGWRIRKDGTRFWANVVITALRDSSGKLVGFAKVTRDLTERREAEEKAIADARRLAKAEEANRVKMSFLAAMSHELRTPLNAIGGYADLLLAGIGGQLSLQQRQYLERIQRSQQHLLAIINDILNFSRIDAGHLDYDMQTVSLDELMATTVPMIEPQARAKGIHVESRGCQDSNVTADRSKVEQILLNLLSNAVKFTPAGGWIELTCEHLGDRVVLRVRDTGIGIPPEELRAIFQPFVQVGRRLTSAHEGTGLGLAISSDLAKAMGGDLTVESSPDVGSTFTLILPAAAAAT
jgi:PAS domain S-box-containing protein